MIWEVMELKLKLEVQTKLKAYIQIKRKIMINLEKLKRNFLI